MQPMSLLGAIVFAASALVSTRALPDAAVPGAPVAKVVAPATFPSVIGAPGVIEIPGSTAHELCENDDAKYLAAGEQLVRDAAIADAMRARLVREHLTYVAGPAAMLWIEHDERDFAADRAEIRAVRNEVAQDEHELVTARCDASEADRTALSLQPNASVEVRIELPTRYLLSLEQGLSEGRDSVRVQTREPLSQHPDAIATK